MKHEKAKHEENARLSFAWPWLPPVSVKQHQPCHQPYHAFTYHVHTLFFAYSVISYHITPYHTKSYHNSQATNHTMPCFYKPCHVIPYQYHTIDSPINHSWLLHTTACVKSHKLRHTYHTLLFAYISYFAISPHTAMPPTITSPRIPVHTVTYISDISHQTLLQTTLNERFFICVCSNAMIELQQNQYNSHIRERCKKKGEKN